MGYLMLVCLAGLVSGILISSGVPGQGLFFYLFPVVLLLAACGMGPRVLGILDRRRLLTGLLGFACFFATGWYSVYSTGYRSDPDPPGGHEILAKVVSYRAVTDKLGQVVVRVLMENENGDWKKKQGRLLLTVRPGQGPVYQPGECWRFSGMAVARVSRVASRSGFVPSRYWLSQGVRYEARIRPEQARLVKKARFPGITALFMRWQEKLSSGIDRIPISAPAAALTKAMILGDRTDVDKETMTDFSRAGIIHVLSVSGLHVGIIYLIISFVLKRISILGPLPRSMLILTVVWLYAGITGFSPSALRAAGMITLFELARIGRRGTPSLEVLAGTALIHCLADPYAVFSAGAQLSYLAVAGIFIWSPVYAPVLAGKGRVVRYFGNSVGISLAAQSLTTPLLLFWFGWFPLYFLAGNLVLLPLMVVGFYLGLGIAILNMAGVTVGFLCSAMDLLVRLAVAGSKWLGNLPGNLVQPGGLTWIDLLIYYLLLYSIRAYADKPKPGIPARLLLTTCLLLLCRIFLARPR